MTRARPETIPMSYAYRPMHVLRRELRFDHTEAKRIASRLNGHEIARFLAAFNEPSRARARGLGIQALLTHRHRIAAERYELETIEAIDEAQRLYGQTA